MMDERDERSRAGLGDSSGAAAPAGTEQELLAALRRLERIAEEMRGLLETTARVQRHRAFSFARLLGALFEALVGGLLFAALMGWVYDASPASLLVELALAGVLQLVALTAFVVARDES
ncbi:MAG TPA: hypothetical protein PLP66_00540 [Phycisphaerae bacterium]|nr:hypothetical protein [Phycisphaerae bacterium]HPM22360.1 hypothetical protein [Phycisphaerae bacterium]